MTTVTVFGRHGCHLCEVATSVLEGMQAELNFEIEKIYIDGNLELEKLCGEQIPVIHIGGNIMIFLKLILNDLDFPLKNIVSINNFVSVSLFGKKALTVLRKVLIYSVSRNNRIKFCCSSI